MAENIMPEEAARLMNEENYLYIDVRSIAGCKHTGVACGRKHRPDGTQR